MSGRLRVYVGGNNKTDWTVWPTYPASTTVATVLGEIQARLAKMVEYPIMQGDAKIICTTEYHEVQVDSPISKYRDMCINYDSEFYVHFESVEAL
jgi:hypothetical protein